MTETPLAADLSRRSLAERYLATRRVSEEICRPLEVEDYVIQTMTEASPPKWHLAHSSWFFETFLLKPFRPNYREFHPLYNYLFNSYYEAVGERHPRPKRGALSRPTTAETLAYRAHVDRAVTEWIETAAAEALDQARDLVELGLQHEQQHQELLITDLKSVLAANPLKPVYKEAEPEPRRAAPPLEWIEFAGGEVEVGHADDGFCFDNELPRHAVRIEPFRLASRPATNGEYLDFIADGGYREPRWWLSLGWERVREQGWQAPLYWRFEDGEWRCFTLAGDQPINPDEPVCHLSCFEADAYAAWAGKRLPTEAEWETAAAGEAVEGALYRAGDSPRPRVASPNGRRAHQIYGDVWEWTSSAYGPYPGYRAAEGAIGEYNGKFMCNQYVLRGGSCATPVGHIRPSYRNFFPPESRWQFSGVRLAE